MPRVKEHVDCKSADEAFHTEAGSIKKAGRSPPLNDLILKPGLSLFFEPPFDQQFRQFGNYLPRYFAHDSVGHVLNDAA